ncbi:MAG: hypothetical protein JRC69_08770 [Deltaproteobacteria bacterium]|nr:hypothetical protein [Deltaproteobacteria bacterium]
MQFFYYFGVHTVRRNDRKIVTTNKMKTFYDAITVEVQYRAHVILMVCKCKEVELDLNREYYFT